MSGGALGPSWALPQGCRALLGFPEESGLQTVPEALSLPSRDSALAGRGPRHQLHPPPLTQDECGAQGQLSQEVRSRTHRPTSLISVLLAPRPLTQASLSILEGPREFIPFPSNIWQLWASAPSAQCSIPVTSCLSEADSSALPFMLRSSHPSTRALIQ